MTGQGKEERHVDGKGRARAGADRQETAWQGRVRPASGVG